MKQVVVAMMFAAGWSFAAAAADEAFWSQTTTTDRSVYWGTTANWKNASGDPLPVPPTTEDKAVTLVPLTTTYGHQTVSTGRTWADSPSVQNLSIDSVAGDARHVIRHTDDRSMGQPNVQRVFAVRSPNDFAGFWETFESWATIRLLASPGFVSALSNVRTTYRPFVEVPMPGTMASVETLYGGGALQKIGAGELLVKGTSGYDTRVYAVTGTVTLAGQTAVADLASLLAEATFHLDASDPATLQTAEDGHSVTNWLDVRGNGLAACRPPDSDLKGRSPAYVSFQNVGLPFVSDEVSPTGLHYVDFGARILAEATSFGPTNCLMKLPKGLQIREAFYVVRYHSPIVFNPVLGDNGLYTFFPNGAGGVFGGSTAPAVANGDLRANGQRVDYLYPLGTAATVFSVGALAPVTATLLGCSDYVCDRCGGFLLGELVLFDRELTRVERLRVDRYLRDKWLRPGANATELSVGQVIVTTDEAAVGVPSGAVANVADLVAATTNVTKTGAGTLVVDRLSPANATISVHEGDIRFRRLTAALSEMPQPAAGAYIHLDAALNLELKTFGGNPTNYVASWADCRPGVTTVATTRSGSEPPKMPYVVADAAGAGLNAVSFGLSDWGNNSWMGFPNWDDFGGSQTKGNAYAGFVVCKFNTSDGWLPIFGSSNSDMARNEGNYHGRLLSPTYAGPTASAALWTIDGEIADPWAYRPDALRQSERFVVIGFSGSEPCRVDGIAKFRTGGSYANYCGGVQIGEMLVYDHPLSDLERRETEAYLMKKWLGRDLPDASPRPTLAFSESVAPVLDFADDVTLSSVSGGDRTLTKRGTGSVTLASAPEGLLEIFVEEGTLSVPVPKGSFLDEALFHFDALDDSTLVKAQDDTYGTYVSMWLDSRGNGVFAETVMPGDARSRQDFIKRPASLVELETAPGVTRPFLDFGHVLGGNSAAMWMNREFLNVRESHVIYKDRSKNSLFLSHSNYNPVKTKSAVDYFRDSSGSFVGGSASATVRNGTFWSNGVQVANPATDLLPTTPSLVSICATGDTAVNSIQEDRGVPGGAYVGEEIAFCRSLTDAERAYLTDLMMSKWFADRPMPVWTNAHYAVASVRDGAALDFGSGEPVVGALSGAGTIVTKRLFGVERLAVSAADLANGKCLTVDGSVRFGDAVMVALVGLAPGAELPTGEYPILQTDGLENADIEHWTLVGGESVTSRTFSFVVTEGILKLKVKSTKRGLVLMVR